MSHLSWEQKIVSQGLKTVAINGFSAWRIYERRDILESDLAFKSIESWINALKKVQSTADFMIDAALDLLIHAQTV